MAQAPDMTKIDTLGKALAEAAMRTLVRLCPEARNATTATLDAACAAMRAAGHDAIRQLLDDAKAVPGLAQAAFATAALTMANAGIKVIRAHLAG